MFYINKASTTQVFSLHSINTETKDIKIHFSTNIDTLSTVNRLGLPIF